MNISVRFKISQAVDNNSFLVRWNERVVIMHSYAEVIEMKRANVRNDAFVRRVIEISERVVIIRSPRASPHSNATLRLRLVVISLVREELIGVSWW